MKYCMIISDGMAGYPLDELDGKTSIDAADSPCLDYIAANGQLGTVRSIPTGFSPGSDVAAMSLLGYAPESYYTGRAPIEAASLGIELPDNVTAFRCNFVTAANNILEDYSAGHITDDEAEVLISALNEELGTREITFHPGKSYRHIMTYRGPAKIAAVCTPPHDITGQQIDKNLPRGDGDDLLKNLMYDSCAPLSRHAVNAKRSGDGKNQANMIWLWGYGRRPSLPDFYERFHLECAVISAVDLVNGLATLMGMDVINVPGVTGNIDTDYDAKAAYAIDALNDHDLVVVHIEAPDEMGHCGNVTEKVKAIENIDEKIVTPVLTAMRKTGDFRITVLPDHYTPIAKRTHTREPVPFAIYGSGIERGTGQRYTEENADNSGLHLESGPELMTYLLMA